MTDDQVIEEVFPVPRPEWDYSFSVWPNEGREPVLYQWLRLTPRCCLEQTTESEWAAFVDRMGREGFTLREVERVPYHLPEFVQ